MVENKNYRRFLGLSLLAGCAALIYTFHSPSKASAAVFAGYSLERLLLGAVFLLLLGGLALLYFQSRHWIPSADTFIRKHDNVYFLFVGIQATLFAALWLFRFSWLFVSVHLRGFLLWVAFTAAIALIFLRIDYNTLFRQGNFREKYRLFPRLADLNPAQKRALAVLCILSLIYLMILLPSNINGSRDMADFEHYGGDEFVIYPILRNVVTPGEDYRAWLYHHYIHEDYHYGYPFYAWSSLVLLPYRLLFGQNFMDRINFTLPTLRIMVSVIPLMSACLILTYIFTRFRKPWLAAAVYVFLLTAPGSLQNNQGFWHPDGLNLFFVCCTLYFLQRDRFRYGRNFYLAAFFCGLSAAIRLYGFFFFLAIFVYLLLGTIRKALSVKTAIRKGFFYILLMCLTILWADPFLFRADARENMLKIIGEKTGEMSSGYNADFNDPKNDYRPGWDAWYPAFEDHYTEMYCFFFLILSLVTACRHGELRLSALMTLCWWLVIAVYLIFFVAVKSTQYVLPMMLPLMSCIFLLPESLKAKKRVAKPTWLLSGAVYLSQLVINLIKIAPRF